MKVAIIGAGPAGLTAAYLLAQNGVATHTVESDARHVGGISKTVECHGCRIDVGGHRFYSKSKWVNEFWDEILGADMMTRNRSSRIFYNKKFFSYPIEPWEAFFKLGPMESFACVLSYCRARLLPEKAPRSFEDWVSNRFGRRLYEIFFKTYTEKVWGLPCREISADWAAQRIRGLSLFSAVREAFFPRPGTRTLLKSFKYPRRGPGMMWEACAAKVAAMGGTLTMGMKVVECLYDAPRKVWRLRCEGRGGESSVIEADNVISTAPLRELAHALRPAPPALALAAAESLKYRDFITVALILKDRGAFDDNWIYIHDPSVRVGRIQNFKAWSPEMVSDPSLCCYGLEYFCFEGDGLWASSDAELIEKAKTELEILGFARAAEVFHGCVLRQPKAYPVYDSNYLENVAVLRQELAAYPGLQVAGRNAMHRYNNQDHSMVVAKLCVENLLNGRKNLDPWAVGQDGEYFEEDLRSVPQRLGD